MIKLNNKNITYVALADSSNSLKAPKEVWYADSNNSVKLVYRRKDALIEGEDYEKYHWLKGDGNAYIDTLVKKLKGTITVDINRTAESSSSCILGRESSDASRCNAFLVHQNNYFFVKIWGRTTNSYQIDIGMVDTLYLNLDTQTASTKSGNSTYINILTNSYGYNMLLFTENYGSGPASPRFHGSIGNFKMADVINLIPCKLLKPVPKWLDANGIRRQVGECGMIDLISGKFYGNVNSVGTFTVENYYERKEWLQGDGSAYIDTLVALKDVTAYKIKAQKDEYYMKSLFGANDSESDRLNVLIYSTADGVWRVSFGNTDKNLVPFSSDAIEIEWDGSNVYVNGENKTSISYSTASTTTCTLFFCKGIPDYRIFNGKIASLTIPSKINLVPCTLTMDLPASMDANNTPRTKGTSGMWDLVSDRFYGNVANSGTFKAVNLAEGVDYEVHSLLVTSVNEGATLPSNVAYITIPTPILLDNKVFTITMGSVHRDLVIYGSVVDGLQYIIIIFTYSSGVTGIQERHGTNTIHSINGTLSGLKSVTLDFKNKVATVGNNSFNIDGVGYQFRGTNATSYDRTKTIGNITIDNELNLVPIKLLKSISSKYDANGIARQAGECGMYDTVNDLFYGNVANSGTFSVEDDE